ncbi:MAG: hybrid sensor histidine kinase/response regulator [Candidatus Margulisiibacteriota bacterium]
MAELDKSKFLAVFKTEADDHVTKLEKGLVKLEKKPKDIELINELNREAHTLKGAARMMGFIDIQDLAHKIEDAFAAIAQKEFEFAPKIADQVLLDLDLIKDMLGKVFKGEKEKPVRIKEDEVLRSSEGAKDEYIRVPLDRVNKLINLVGEIVSCKIKSEYKISASKKLVKLVKEHYRATALLGEEMKAFFASQASPLRQKYSSAIHQCNLDVGNLKNEAMSLGESISSEAIRMDTIVNELQESVRQMRMLPISSVFDTYPRLVRDIAAAQKKKVDLEIVGEGTEIDKKLLEEINPALIHILRNCVDHGIAKEGKIKLSAWHEGGNVIIEIKDDGIGIDPEEIRAAALKKKIAAKEDLAGMSEKEIINLIFLPGFSVSPIITDVSGRGVGLDVVKTQVEKLRGQISIGSARGRGTTVVLKLPLTVAIIKALTVRVEDQVFALPLLSIDESLSVRPQDINTIEGKMAVSLGGHPVPLVRLADVLVLPKIKIAGQTKKAPEGVDVIIASSLDKEIGFMVDGVMGEEEIYIKSLGEYLGRIRNIEGAAILGTGEVIVVLDVPGLIESARSIKAGSEVLRPEIEKKARKKILVVEDSLTTRELERSILEAQGYEVVTAIDGLEAVDKVARSKPDLIVTDVEMPRMDGFEMCRTLKKNDEYKDIPVVMVTVLEKEQDKRKGIEAGADAYITKGAFDQKNLLETIERLVG